MTQESKDYVAVLLLLSITGPDTEDLLTKILVSLFGRQQTNIISSDAFYCSVVCIARVIRFSRALQWHWHIFYYVFGSAVSQDAITMTQLCSIIIIEPEQLW